MNTTIVVLACSIKHGGKCLAGKKISDKSWVRPVGNCHGKELSNVQATCENTYGVYPIKLLQKVTIDITDHVPLKHQPENFLFSDNQIQQAYKIDKSELTSYLDSPQDLWGQEASVSTEEIDNGELIINQSLYLVRVDDLVLYVNPFDKRRARFNFNNICYDLSVTCPNFDALLDASEDINGILCISLGEEYEGSHWKIIAAIY